MTTRALDGGKRLGTERTVDVYAPVRYGVASERPIGTVYLFDGDSYLRDMRIANVLDNLIGERRIAPLVAVMIRDLPGSARDRELMCDPNFTEFLTTELVPWVRRNYSVSADPRRTIVGGFSLGGLEAAYAASVHPELFGAVLSQSGSFWWRPSSPGTADLSEPWMATRYAAVGPRQVSVFPKCRALRAGPAPRRPDQQSAHARRSPSPRLRRLQI